MLWKGQRKSDNVEDGRSGGGGGKVVGGGIGVLVIALIVYLLGGDPSQVLQQAGGLQQTQESNQPITETAEEKEAVEFVSVVLGQTEDVWHKLFQETGSTYTEPKLHLFRNNVESACGIAGAATGPFYCPGDSKVYIDLSFYDILKNKLNSPGDFAMAYVIAHEVGHHIQNLMGISNKVHAMREKLSEPEYNKLSVRMALLNKGFAGLRKDLKPGI